MTIRAEVVPFSGSLWSGIEGPWRSLLERTGETSAFLSAAWIGTWLDVYGPTLRPSGIVWRDADGAAVGCALLSVQRGRIGPVPVTRGYLNASAPLEWSCEHNDVLVTPEARADVLDDLTRRVHGLPVDEWVLVGVREKLARELSDRWPGETWNGYFGEAPYVSLEPIRDASDSYLDHLSSNTRGQIRRSIRLFERVHGPPSLRRASNIEDAEAWFGEMLSLHEARWRSMGKPGAFANPRTLRFHESLIRRCIDDGAGDRLTVDLVRVGFGDRVVGFLYNLRYRDRVSFLQCGFRYDDDNRLKPGLVAHTMAVRHYARLGALEYDFLGGEPEPVQYKRSLSTDARALAWVQLSSPTPKMRLVYALRTAGRRLRPLVSWARRAR